MNFVIILLAAVGFAISLYGYFVEEKVKADSSYKPICDISEQVSCSKAFSSQYGKLLGFTNTVAGMIFYAAVLLLTIFGYDQLVFYSSVAACAASVGLAYILFFRVKSYCLVCTAIYAINILLLIFSYADL